LQNYENTVQLCDLIIGHSHKVIRKLMPLNAATSVQSLFTLLTYPTVRSNAVFIRIHPPYPLNSRPFTSLLNNYKNLAPPPSRELLIISDSQTTIQNIAQPLYRKEVSPITIFIRNILQYLMHYQNCKATFLISGYETADRLARTTNNTSQFFPFQTCNDILSQLRHSQTQYWTQYHQNNIGKLLIYKHIQPNLRPKPWFLHCPQSSRKTIVSICQIRFGHHRLPASLARFIPNISPYCPLHPETLTLYTPNHIFQCPELLPLIQKFENLLALSGAQSPWSIASLIAHRDPLVYLAIAQFINNLSPKLLSNQKYSPYYPPPSLGRKR